MKLSVKNFQPWADATLNIEGLTVLVGPSNKGKSSLFRALKGVLRNEIPEDFIRNNQEDPLEIELEVDGHHIQVTRKRKGSTKYILDGKAYSSLGGKVPEEIEKLKFGEVKIGGYSIDPIFAHQNKAQFLIDPDRWKPQEINAILGAFSSTEKLDAGKKEANLRITQRKSEANTLASEVRSAEERAAGLLEITGKATVIADAILDLERGVRDDEMLVGQLGSSLHHRARLEPLQTILDALTLPDLTETTTLALKSGNLELAGGSFVASRFLRKVETSLDEIASAWSDLVVNFKRTKGLDELFPLLGKSGVSRMEFANQLTALIEQVETQLTEAKTLGSSISYVGVAIASAQAYKTHSSAIAEEDSQLETAEAELEVLRQEFAADEAKNKVAAVKPGICPKCGKILEHVCQ